MPTAFRGKFKYKGIDNIDAVVCGTGNTCDQVYYSLGATDSETWLTGIRVLRPTKTRTSPETEYTGYLRPKSSRLLHQYAHHEVVCVQHVPCDGLFTPTVLHSRVLPSVREHEQNRVQEQPNLTSLHLQYREADGCGPRPGA